MGCVAAIFVVYRYAAAWMDLTKSTIVMTHFQLMYVYFSFGFEYPAIVEAASRPLGLFTPIKFVFDAIHGWGSPSCMGLGEVSYLAWWCAKMATPVIFIVPYVILYLSVQSKSRAEHVLYAAIPEERRLLSVAAYEARKARQLVGRKAMQSLLFVCITSFMHGISASVNVWSCAEFPDGSLRINEDPSIVCELENPSYQALLCGSIIVFAVYFFGISFLFIAIVENEQARQSAARHNVTHAKLLRDANFAKQLGFLGRLIYFGPKHGDLMERRRLFNRLRFHVKTVIVALRLEKQRHQKDKLSRVSASSPRRSSDVQPERGLSFQVDLRQTHIAMKRYYRTHRLVPAAERGHFQNVFPVLVQNKGAWAKGIFHGLDAGGLPLVATGEGPELCCQSYENVRICFENGRAVMVTGSLQAWQNQPEDPMNALKGAPLEAYGKISLAEPAKALVSEESRSGDNFDEMGDNLPKHVNMVLPTGALFTFYLDISEPMGFDFHERWGKILVRAVNPVGQGAIAGLVDKCRIQRVGNSFVRTTDEFKLAIVKRRIVSAHMRRDAGLPLGVEDGALVSNPDVGELVSKLEFVALENELRAVPTFSHVSVTYVDPSFSTTRRLPGGFLEFHRLASFRPDEPQWEKYGFFISTYTSSSRHFEVWANVRKTLALVVEVFLARYSLSAQATTMMAVSFVALFLQVRLRPYDDGNVKCELNDADSVMSNNDLETVLLVLQILQLGVGLLTLHVRLPGVLVAMLYLLLIASGVVLSVVGLSTSISRGVHAVLKTVEPATSALQRLVGCGAGDLSASSGADALQKKNAAKLLEMAHLYESSKAKKVPFAEALVPCLSVPGLLTPPPLSSHPSTKRQSLHTSPPTQLGPCRPKTLYGNTERDCWRTRRRCSGPKAHGRPGARPWGGSSRPRRTI